MGYFYSDNEIKHVSRKTKQYDNDEGCLVVLRKIK